MKWKHTPYHYGTGDEYMQTAVENLPDEMEDNEVLIAALDYLRDVINELDARPSDERIVEIERESWEEGLESAVEIIDQALYEQRLFEKQTTLEDIQWKLELKKEER